MADVTKPMLLDETGQDILSALQAIGQNVKPSASDIQYDSSLSVKGKIDKLSDDIGSFWSVDWTATSCNAINIQLTNHATLDKGVYIAIGNAPTVSVNDYVVAIRASKSINAKTVYNTIRSLSSLVFTFEVTSDDTEVYIASASSTSVTFSNLTNGGFRVLKIK